VSTRGKEQQRGQSWVHAGVSPVRVIAKARATLERENRMIAFCTLSSVSV
jgi:hypothetical protein